MSQCKKVLRVKCFLVEIKASACKTVPLRKGFVHLCVQTFQANYYYFLL